MRGGTPCCKACGDKESNNEHTLGRPHLEKIDANRIRIVADQFDQAVAQGAVAPLDDGYDEFLNTTACNRLADALPNATECTGA